MTLARQPYELSRDGAAWLPVTLSATAASVLDALLASEEGLSEQTFAPATQNLPDALFKLQRAGIDIVIRQEDGLAFISIAAGLKVRRHEPRNLVP